MSATVTGPNGENLVIPYDNQGDSVVIPFPSNNSAEYVLQTFADPIENYAPGIQQSDYITSPSQIANGLPNSSTPTALFLAFDQTAQSTLDLSGQDVYGVVNASTVPVTIEDSDPTLGWIINSIYGTTLDVSAPNGNAAFAGGDNWVQFGTSGIENWYLDFEGGVNTIVGGAGNVTITGSPTSDLMFLGSGDTTVYSEGADTIVGTTGAETIQAIGPALAFGGSGTMTFIDSSTPAFLGTPTVVGGSGALSAYGGSGQLVAFSGTSPNELFIGGTMGDNILVAQSTADTIYGGGTFNIEVAGPGGNDDTLIGGASGTTYMFGSATNATGNVYGGPLISSNAVDWVVPVAGTNTIFGGNAGSDTSYIFTGAANNTIYGNDGVMYIQEGTGTNTVYQGNGYALFGFVDGYSGGTLDIYGFNPANAGFVLTNYPAGTETQVIDNVTVAGGNTSFTLPDHTQVTIENYTGGLSPHNFV